MHETCCYIRSPTGFGFARNIFQSWRCHKTLNTTFSQKKYVKGVCDEEEQELAAPPFKQEVQLQAGNTASLYTFDEDAGPSACTDEVISVKGNMVLESSLVLLGEYGTIRDLAESELYHWAHAAEFNTARYTHPIKLGDRRYRVWLRLDNLKVGMEQCVVYTCLGNRLARVDRLWRTITEQQDDKSLTAFSGIANWLASDETL